MAVESHQAKNTSVSHLNKFYQTFPDLKDQKFDGMIVTGAPVEQMEFEEVDYWKELDRNHGLDRKPCNFNDLFVLGSAGESLPFLRTSETTA